jgi:hypothetical protein
MELTSIGFMFHNIPYRIDVPVIHVNRRDASNRVVKRQDNRIAGRVVVAHVKALLVDVQLGLMDFQQAMVGHLALSAGEGQPVSLYDVAGHESFADWLSRSFRESEFSGPLLTAGEAQEGS